tara:strand:- start:11462 stop:11851 length:390 start_codon:yes stop_codon:yes gene_type:complete
MMNNDIRNETAAGLQEIQPDELKRRMEARDVLLIDVREPGEFEAERIPGAVLYPLSEFDPRCLPVEVFPSVVLMCGSGKRSATAARRVLDSGVGRTTHLAGGIMAWKKANLPTISFDPATGGWRRGPAV